MTITPGRDLDGIPCVCVYYEEADETRFKSVDTFDMLEEKADELRAVLNIIKKLKESNGTGLKMVNLYYRS